MVDFKKYLKTPSAAEPALTPPTEWLGELQVEREARRAKQALVDISWLLHSLESRYYGDEGGFAVEDVMQTFTMMRKALVKGMPHPMNAQYQRQGVKLRKGHAPKGETTRFLEGLELLDEDKGPLAPEEIPF